MGLPVFKRILPVDLMGVRFATNIFIAATILWVILREHQNLNPIWAISSMIAAADPTVEQAKKFFHGSVVSMAQRIDVAGDRIVFTFAPIHRVLRGQLDQQKPWLETLASQLAGRRMSVVSVEGTAAAPAGTPGAGGAQPGAKGDRQAELRQQAMSDSGVQAMLDVFGGEIKEIEEM